MKRLALFALGFLLSLPVMVYIARLRQFMLEPDYIVRNGSIENPEDYEY